MGGLSGGEARRRVEGALRELENEGKIAPGSARIVGFVKHTPGAFRFRFDDGQGAVEYRGLDSGPSKR
jgi:hypothetical protein